MTPDFHNMSEMPQPENLRILFLINDLGRGGAERFLVDHCHGLSEYKNIDFVIGTLYDNNQYPEESANFRIVNLNYEINSLFSRKANPALRNLIRDFKPDIIHTNLYLAEFLSATCYTPGIKYVCHGHDNMPQMQNWTWPALSNKAQLLNFVEKQLLNAYKYRLTDTYFIANSTHTYNYYRTILPKRQQKNVVKLEYGFRYDRFHNPEPKSIKKDGIINIVNVGSFQKKKNQQFIVDIARAAVNLAGNIRFHLAGDGAHRQEVEEKVAAAGLSSFFEFHGVVNDVQRLYRQSDIYLHTATYEPFGLVFLEAMAAGLPVISLDGLGNRDLIVEGHNGYIFGEQDADVFAKAILSLVDDPAKYNRMSEAAKQFAKSYDLPLKTKLFVDFYYSIFDK